MRLGGSPECKPAPCSGLRFWAKPQLKGRGDSEGLAIAPDGTAYVSFEGGARVLVYSNLSAKPSELPRPKAFKADATQLLA